MGEEDGGVVRDGDADLFGQPCWGFADDGGGKFGCFFVLGVVFREGEHELFEFLLFLVVELVGPEALELFDGVIVDGVVEDGGLFGGANHAVVEGFGDDDVVDGAGDVGGFVDVGGDVAGSDSEGGFAAGVGGAHHGVSAGGEDAVYAVVVHEGVGSGHGGFFDPLDAVFGGAGADGGVADDGGCFDAAVVCAGVEGEDDGVAGF